MFKLSLALAVLVFVSACASTHMKQYQGRDIRDVVLDSGPPVNVFDYGDGRRVFQFRWGGGTYVVPQSTTTTGSVSAIGNTAWYQQQSITTGGGTVTSEGCIISYITTWSEERQAWVVTEYHVPPQLVC